MPCIKEWPSHNQQHSSTHWWMMSRLIAQSVACNDTTSRCWLSPAQLHRTSLPAWRPVLFSNSTHLSIASTWQTLSLEQRLWVCRGPTHRHNGNKPSEMQYSYCSTDAVLLPSESDFWVKVTLHEGQEVTHASHLGKGGAAAEDLPAVHGGYDAL